MTSNRKRHVYFSLSLGTVKRLKMHSLVQERGSTSSFVVMPWDDKREIKLTKDGITKTFTKWELIQNQMDLSNPINNVTDFISVIKSYNVLCDSKGGKQSTLQWKCLVLQKYFSNLNSSSLRNFFGENGILSTIRNLVLKSRDLVPSLEVLRSGTNATVKLHQMQVASLLANAFMCTFPRARSDCPSINFHTLYESSTGSVLNYNVEKIKCLMNYFDRIHRKHLSGSISFHRLCIPDHKFPRWDKTNVELRSLNVNESGKIEDQNGHVHVDFANKYVGGGVLGRGCVQEEIRFVICPELIVARLFTESLGENEALLVVGAERFSKYSGYSNTFKFAGDYQDSTPFDESGRRKSYLTVVDALCFHHFPDQFRESKILRELKKAYVGFKPTGDSNSLPLATGNWGCGAFGGDPQLKSLLQLMASSQAGRNVLYLTFGDVVLKEQLEEVYRLLRENSVNVGMLYRILRLYQRERKNKQTVFEFVKESVEKIAKEKVLQSSSSSTESFMMAQEPSESGQTFMEKSETKQNERENVEFPEMEVDFDILDEAIKLDSANNPVDCSESISGEKTQTPVVIKVWFENETNRVERRQTEEMDVSTVTCSPSLFSEEEETVEKSQASPVPAPNVQDPTSSQKVSQTKNESGSSQGGVGKRLVQKKITDCFIRK